MDDTDEAADRTATAATASGGCPFASLTQDMRTDHELALVSLERESVLAIGVFDGVHRGHQRLISHVTAEASKIGRLSGVLTFRNHPASVLSPHLKPRYVTSLDERVRLIEDLGVDFVVPVTFDLELSRVRARQFVALLQKRLRMRGMVAGPDFALGHNREANVEILASLGREMGFTLSVVAPLVDEEGRTIKSTAVRDALARGDVTRVAAQLGRDFVLEGTVVRGHGRGELLGFPTANLQPPPETAIPGDGVYATLAHVDHRRYMAATSIGKRPTFGVGAHTVEAFILDFQGELHGQGIRLEFVQRLRDEAKYETVQALQEQVARDVDRTRAILRGDGFDSGPTRAFRRRVE